MILSATKLRAIVNLLSDPGSAANAAGILAREAQERGLLVADLVAQTMGSAPAAPPPPSAPPRWQDVEPADDGGPYVRRIDVDHVGLVGAILGETDKAWLVEKPDGSEAWLAKSVVQNQRGDPQGRAILVLPKWLCRKIGLAA
jgi:hypothetical protein